MGTTYTALNNHDRPAGEDHRRAHPGGGPARGHVAPLGACLRQVESVGRQVLRRGAGSTSRDIGNMRVNLSFTPTYTYTRADCPQYAGLKGPSCYTAPLVRDAAGAAGCACAAELSAAQGPDAAAGNCPRAQRQPGRRRPAATSTRPRVWPTRIHPCRRGWLRRRRYPARPTLPWCPHRRRPRRSRRLRRWRRNRGIRHRCRRRRWDPRRPVARCCPPKPHPPASVATSARSVARRNVSNSASSPASRRRRRPSCCSVRWRAERRCRWQKDLQTGSTR